MCIFCGAMSGWGLGPWKRFRGGLVCKAHRLLYHSTLGLRVIKKKTGQSKHAAFTLVCKQAEYSLLLLYSRYRS